MSSRLRLLLESVPTSCVDPAILAANENQILAWQLDIGSELSTENVPLAHVVLVVEGTFASAAVMRLDNPSHSAGFMRASGGVFGVAFPVFRLLLAVQPKPPKC